MFIILLMVTIAVFVPALAIFVWDLLSTESGAERRNAQWTLAAIIFSVGLAVFGYSSLIGTGLAQTSALFVGIPVLLSIACVFAPKGRSSVGVAVQAVTIGLLISMIFLGEGMICVFMSAPLFYLVAFLMAKLHDENKDDDQHDRGRSRIFSLLAMMAVAPLSVEGVLPMTTINRNVVVSETRIVAATPDQVAGALVAPPRFDRVLPFYLGIGFPRPTMTRIDGTRWIITMRGGEMRLNGMEPRSGNLVLAIDDQGPGFISWRALSDDSHMRHFLRWQSSRVEWQWVDAAHTRVTWTIRYSRDLDPAWYFGPMERYAVHLAAGYLIDAVATP